MTKTIHFHWENRFVLQWYGAVRKLYQYFHSFFKTGGEDGRLEISIF